MARPRKPLGPVGYLKKEARIAAKQMMPHRVLWRVLGPGTAFPSKRSFKRKYGTHTVRVDAQTRQADVQRAQAADARAAKKAAAPMKTAVTRPDPYQVAAGLPGRNRQAAAKIAKATQPRKTVAVRKNDGSGRFDGRKAMRADELTVYERAQAREVDPVLLPRSPRRRAG